MRVFALIHAAMAALFACAAIAMIYLATRMGWAAINSGDQSASQQIIEAIGLLGAAVVALQISQTITEEEVVRAAHVSGPTRVRRFLSRFMVVLVVALAVEGLVATFKALHENPSQLPFAASVIFATGVLLAGWGVFIRFNRDAEELEPEAMAEAKLEDRKLSGEPRRAEHAVPAHARRRERPPLK